MKRAVSVVAFALTLNLNLAQAQDAVEYYHLDGVGSVRAISDQAGTLLERHDYLPFGEECVTGPCAASPGAGGGQARKFTGKERDSETGLDYSEARYYGSTMGRFTTADPLATIEKNLAVPQRWNRYAYGLNHPLKWADRDGRDVSIAIQFTGAWTSKERSSVIGRVVSWYAGQGVGNVHVFDAAAMEHGAWFASLRTGYANIEVKSASGDRHSPDIVFAGNFDHLPDDQRLNAISNSVVHETAAHHFDATYGGADALTYSRKGRMADNPEARKRFGTVADSFAYGDEATRSNVTDGPIPIDSDDQRRLLDRVGPSVRVKPPVDR